jgi:hypothetical protein
MAKGPQGWVQCEDRLPYVKDNSCRLPRLHDFTTREDGTSPQIESPKHHPNESAQRRLHRPQQWLDSN